jgi:DHA1 family bicyclomycin/chloramphenicol resistance-like MFS transporter
LDVSLGRHNVHFVRHREHEPPLSVPIFLVASTWVSVLSTDLYAPSLTHLPELLGTTEQLAAMTMSFNLAAFAVAQLVHGPLADRFGRRGMLVAGMTGYAIASSLCAMAPSIETLIMGRTLQGLLSSVPSVVVLLLIHELYGTGRAVRILGFHGMAVGFAPIVGPLVGGFVFITLGWRVNFWMLALFAASVAVLVSRNVPETLAKPLPLRLRATVRSYLAVVSRREVLAHLLPLAAPFGVLFAFVTAGPFLLIGRYGVATEHYGFYFGAVIVAAMGGSLIANRLGGRVDIDTLEKVAFGFAALGVLSVALAVFVPGIEGALSVTTGMMVFAVGLRLMNSSAPLLILEGAGGAPKSIASAVAGSAQLLAATGASFLVGLLQGEGDEGGRPMVLVMIALMAIGCAGFALRGIKA